MIELRRLLQEVSRREEIQSDKEYKILGVRWYAKGLFIKDIKKGSEIQANYIYKVNKGDFIYSRLFAWKGSFAIATEEFDGCYVSNEFPCFLVKDDQINIEYLMWYFNQPHVWDNCLENSEGSTAISRNRLKVEKFLSLEIPLPSLELQHKKATILNNVNDMFMSLMELKEDSDNRITYLRQSILQQAVKGKLVPQDPNDEPASVLLERIRAEKSRLIKDKKISADKKLFPQVVDMGFPWEIPSSWEWVRINDLFEVLRGGSPRPSGSPEFFGGNIPWITVAEITKDTSKYLDYTSSTLNENGKQKSRTIYPNELLLTNSGATLGVPKISRIEGCINDGVALLRLFHPIDITNYALLFLSHQTQAFRKINQGMGQPNLNTSIISSWYFPLPPLDEQKRILEKVDLLMALCDVLEEAVEQSKCDSEMLLQSVLKEAFSQPEKENNVVEFPLEGPKVIEDWEIAARSDGEIDTETKVKIKKRVTELLGKSRQ